MAKRTSLPHSRLSLAAVALSVSDHYQQDCSRVEFGSHRAQTRDVAWRALLRLFVSFNLSIAFGLIALEIMLNGF